MKQAVIDLYDEYARTSMPRRQFLERLAQVAGSAAARIVFARSDADIPVVVPSARSIDTVNAVL